MSSDKQDASPSQQHEHIAKLAVKSNCRIIGWYEDLAVSGNDIHRRVEFRRMIADAANGLFARILCWSQDRFGRFDSIEAGEWIAPLRRAGVMLLTVAEGEINWNDALGRLVYTIQQEGKHNFLMDLARGVARGLHQRARRSGYYPGTIPYGYEKLVFDERGKFQRRLRPREKLSKPAEWTVKLVPSTDQRVLRTVRWMFRAADKGTSLRSIAMTLNRRSVPSPSGGHWQTTTIRLMLMNPTYAGDQVWNRRRKGKFMAVQGDDIVSRKLFADEPGAKTAECAWNAASNWVVVRNAHPALVDRRLCERVRTMLAKRTHASRRPGNDPLRGIVFCGHCGARLTVDNHRNLKLKGVVYYRRLQCPTAHVKGITVCGYRSVSHEKLLRYLTQLILDRVIDGHVEERLREHLGQRLATGPNQSLDQDLANLMARVARHRVALVGSDSNLIRGSVHDVVARIDIWFGRHPRIRGASMVSRGVIQLRPPFVDRVGAGVAIFFTRQDFLRATAKPPRVRRRPPTPHRGK